MKNKYLIRNILAVQRELLFQTMRKQFCLVINSILNMKNKKLLAFISFLICGLLFILISIIYSQVYNSPKTIKNNVYYEKDVLDCNKFAAIYATMASSQLDNEKDFVKNKFMRIRLQEVFQKIVSLCELDLKDIGKYKKLIGSRNGIPD